MLHKIIKSVWHFISREGHASEHQYVPLGAIGFVSFIIYYFTWEQVAPGTYDSILLRVIGGVLCFFLILKDFWPKFLQPILPLYWFATLTYCFPFFFCFMVFKNPDSSIWIITAITGLFFLLLLVNWIMLLAILIVGISSAWYAYTLSTEIIILPIELFKTLPNYLTVLIAGGIFIYRNDQVQKEKLESLITLSSIIAHELRTPLRTIESSTDGLSNLLPKLTETYNIAKQQNLEIPFIAPQQFQALDQLTGNIKSETYAAFMFIDMLLQKTKANSEGKQEEHMMRATIDTAIQRYPFSKEERENLHIPITGEDFIYFGNDHLILHIFFNLTKNALYYIYKAQKGGISIHLERGAEYNTVRFKDTGTGIAPRDLPHVFERFFSRTHHGTGLGLAFSKMVMEGLGGKISCASVLGEYTEFTLYFPVIHT